MLQKIKCFAHPPKKKSTIALKMKMHHKYYTQILLCGNIYDAFDVFNEFKINLNLKFHEYFLFLIY